jgi:hypothetical protein
MAHDKKFGLWTWISFAGSLCVAVLIDSTITYVPSANTFMNRAKTIFFFTLFFFVLFQIIVVSLTRVRKTASEQRRDHPLGK